MVERRRQQLKEQVLPTLRPSMQTRFARLEEMCLQIDAQPIEGQTWFREVLRKLDYLLDKFLQFASKEAEFRSYLRSLLEEVWGYVWAGDTRLVDMHVRRLRGKVGPEVIETVRGAGYKMVRP